MQLFSRKALAGVKFAVWQLLFVLFFISAVARASDFSLALGVPETGEYGWSWGSRAHRKSVEAIFEKTQSDITLSVRGYDVDNGTEVAVLLNGTRLGYLSQGSNNSLTDVTEFRISGNQQIVGANQLSFVQRVPKWRWGVTDILIESPVPLVETVALNSENARAPSDFSLQLDVPEIGEYGWSWGTRANRESVEAVFENTQSDITLSVRGYDVDNGTEVAVLLNATRLGYLSRGGNNVLADVTEFRISGDQQKVGFNRLSFVQRVPGWRWGVTDILIEPAVPLVVNTASIAESSGQSSSVETGNSPTMNVLSNDDNNGTRETSDLLVSADQVGVDDALGTESGANSVSELSNATPSAEVGFVDENAITDLILVTGQSNVRGSQTDYDRTLDNGHNRVLAFTSAGIWETADLHQAWDVDGWHPGNGSLNPYCLADPNCEARVPYNNFALHFASTVVEADPDRVVGLIIASAPGEGIEHWDAGGEFSRKIETKVLEALNTQGVKAQIDGILWHQGETDWLVMGTSDPDVSDSEKAYADYYPDKLLSLISNFRTQSWFGTNRPFICGETRQAPVNEHLMALNNDGDPNTACVVGSDLATREMDLFATPPKLGTHFNAEALRVLGRRYGLRYLQMTQ